MIEIEKQGHCYELEVLGKVMGKERPRATVIGGHARVYTPKKSQNYEARVASAFQAKYPDTTPFGGALHVFIEVTLPLSKADYRKDGTPTKSGQRKLNREEDPTKKPDIDNIAKAILDGLNGVAFRDDSQICVLCASKRYGIQEKTKITIVEWR